jgi:hypothetical protein
MPVTTLKKSKQDNTTPRQTRKSQTNKIKIYKSTYQFIEGVGEFVKSKLGDKFPTTWGGFNICMTPIPSLAEDKKFLFVSRVYMTYDMLFANKIIPGTKYNTTLHAPHMRPHDWSTYFPWANWGNGIEMSIMFVGTFDSTKGIKVDTSYTPFLLTGCKSSFQKPPCAYKQSKEIGIPSMLLNLSFQFACSDYRIFTLQDHIIMHDAYSNYLHRVNINHEKKNIRIERWVTSVCQLPKSVTGRDEGITKMNTSSIQSSIQASIGGRKSSMKKSTTSKLELSGMETEKFKNELTNGAPYYKYFDKNWSFIGMQGDDMLFLDWFYADGVHAVALDPTTGYCTRKKLVTYNKDSIPRKTDEIYPEFSLGTTTMSISKNKTLIDVIGVGHVKFEWEYIDFNTKSRLYKEVAKIDSIYNKTFGRNYKRHIKYVYASFFYRIKQTSKDNFEMTMSNLWIPFFENEKSKYHSLVYFPMGVIQSTTNNKEFHVSGGLTDFYNLVLTFNKEDVLSKLTHDVSNMNMKKLYIDLIKY